jgi:hypothetical protein
VGDLVPILLGQGLARVRWIGQRLVQCRRHPKPDEVQPVRIEPGAFGPGLPHRALFLSPDHAVHVDGVLIPVRYLVNGSSIAQIDTAEARYWHIELEAHNVLLAEGLPAESYLDTGNRGAFGGDVPQLHPDFALRVWDEAACARLVTHGPILEAVRRRLLALAVGLGHALTDDPDLRLLADGRMLRPNLVGGRYSFRLPAQTRFVRLLSRVVVPAHTNPASSDYRRLGVAVAGLWLDGRVAPGRLRLDGWQQAEPAWQWTDGDALLDCAGAARLDVELLALPIYWRHGSPDAEGQAAMEYSVANRI